MTTPKILIIDDNPDIGQALRVLFTINGMASEQALSPAQGLEKLADGDIDLVIQDMNFSADTTSGQEGISLFHQIREMHPDLPIILITAWTALETAVELVKAGAADYLGKPWDDDKLMVTVRNLLKLGALQRAQREQRGYSQSKRRQLENEFDLCGLQFQSQSMYDLLRITTQVAHADVSVLITGPNGAGKEKIAEIVQANSSCKHGPFIKVNVGALPKDLVEAELFGAEAGAYTGISKRRTGRFELADGGTLFLDEIGNLSLDGQAKLLRVLETGEFERIGGSDTLKVKVRIISATNSDLKAAIAAGSFREDLYYRLNVIELALPALNQRRADILPLARYFLGDKLQLAPCAEQVLGQYEWPGNIRQLKNVMQRASLLCQDQLVKVADLGLPAEVVKAAVLSAEGGTPVPEPSAEDISQAIEEAGGVIADAARSLGLSRSALYRRLKKFELDN
ncbi:sigma-54 dependent transcriptional regulator [Bowmanella sp. Y26]|uniref:sigma-54-dependent transcriptional regulator n=1 Tax=Bowmanella yangjiangensis TaxID=2811230 RepID=UPI001BDC0AF7|nr:sigma-54 dependent transcriptional regulator [Bowmanella yangjiangensis]MBT1063207.1 sigma-54 dependent transcriptional regulator [Bowmanella yangjiangensis]